MPKWVPRLWRVSLRSVRILVYGSLVPDLVYHVPRLPGPGEDIPSHSIRMHPAGGGGNVACALAAWSYRVRGRGNQLGDDGLGRWMRDQLVEREVDVSDDFLWAGALTPSCAIMVTPDGERTMVGSDYAGVRWLEVTDRDWDEVGVAVVDRYSGEAGAAVAAEASRRGIALVGSDLTGAAAQLARLVVWSRAEHPDPAEAAALTKTGPAVVLTNGAGPVLAFDQDREITVNPPAVKAADATAAGDVFAAACAAGIADNLNLEEIVRRAAVVTARFVTTGRAGGIPPLDA